MLESAQPDTLVASVVGLTLPRPKSSEVAKVTTSPATTFPYSSCTRARSWDEAPALWVAGIAHRVTECGGPATKSTKTVADTRLEAVAWIVLGPAAVDITDEWASPAPSVTSVGGVMPPRSSSSPVEKVSVSPDTGLPNRSVTVAVSAALLPTTSVSGSATRLMVWGTSVVKVTTAVSHTPAVAVAVIILGPGSVDMTVAWASPIPSVAAVGGTIVPLPNTPGAAVKVII